MGYKIGNLKYLFWFKNAQGLTVGGNYNVNVNKNSGAVYYGCGNQTASTTYLDIRYCFHIIEATTGDTFNFYYYNSVGTMYSYFDGTVDIYRLN